jgi:hypothetical protein
MSKRVTPTPGLTYADVNRGRIVSFHSDVLGYKQVIEERWPELKCNWDTENEEWCIIECRDHTESLVFATKTLGEHTLERIGRADNIRSDPFETIEAWNAAMDREEEKRNADKIHEIGEKLAWAIRKDEFNGPSPRVFFSAEKQNARIGG